VCAGKPKALSEHHFSAPLPARRCAATGQLKDLLALNQPGGPYPFFQMQRGRVRCAGNEPRNWSLESLCFADSPLYPFVQEPRRTALDGCGTDAFKALFPGECSWLQGVGSSDSDSDSDSEGCRVLPAEPQEHVGAPLPPPTLSNRLCLNAQDVIRSWERQGVASTGRVASAQAATPRAGPPHHEALGGCARRAARAANVLAGAPSAAAAPRGLPFSRALLFAAAARTPQPACGGATAGARSCGHAGENACASGAGEGPGCWPHEGGGSRLQRVARYLHKRRSRPFITKVRYQVRKANAEARPRFKGRFVKNGEEILI